MTQHADHLARYQHLRKVGLALNNRLVETLPKSVLDEGGKNLGILKKNVLTLETEDEIAVLADHCLHDVRRQGVNAIERYLAESPPAPNSDEMALLRAKRDARFSLFAVEATEPGVGVHVRDLLRDETLFLMDVGFSRTAPVGMILASRIMGVEGMYMTTGAPLPVGVLSAAQRRQFVELLKQTADISDFREPSPEQSSHLATTLIRACLRHGAATSVEYREPRSAPTRGRPAPGARSEVRHGRNDRCPCGSGRKFKHCCGARL
jgi:hypothetical protein